MIATLATAHDMKVWKLRLELAWLDVQLSWVRFQLLVFS